MTTETEYRINQQEPQQEPNLIDIYMKRVNIADYGYYDAMIDEVSPLDCAMETLRNDTLGAQFLKDLDTLPQPNGSKQDQGLVNTMNDINNILNNTQILDPDPIVETLESNLAKVSAILENTLKDNTMIKLNRSDSKILKWVQSASGTDRSREVLTGTYFHNNRMVCADGFSLNIIEKPESLKVIEGLKNNR